MTIRPMESTELEEVRMLDARIISEDGPLCRKQSNIIGCFARNQSGCFVAEKEGIVGYVFTRVWGEIGWIGTLCVEGGHRGEGIGKALLSEAVSSLRRSGCRTIGLETMSNSAYNIGFYLGMRFRIGHPRVALTKKISEDQTAVDRTEEATEGDLDFISATSRSALGGLDYATEVRHCLDSPDWITMKLMCGGVSGFAILRAASIYEGREKDSLSVGVFVLSGLERRCFDSVFDSIELAAFDLRRRSVKVPCSAANSEALEWLLQRGYRVRGHMERMLCCGKYGNLRGIDLSCWVM